MKKSLFFALVAVLAIPFVSCSKQASQEPARHFVSADGMLDFDLIDDSIDVFQLFPEAYYSEDGDDLAPICIHNEDILLKYNGSNPQVQQITDFYNIIAMYHNMNSDLETAERFGEDDSEVYEALAASIASADVTYVRDPELQAAIRQLRDTMEYCCRHLPEDHSEMLGKMVEDLFGIITPTAAAIMDGVTERYFEIMDRKDFYTDFDSVIYLRGRSDKDYQLELLTAMDHAQTPMERHMYAIEYAHSDSFHASFVLGAAVLNREFERGEYSPYLSEMWRTWRASLTSIIGHSSWSYIPNHLYNAKRRQVAEIILQQVEKHPTDSMAQGLLIDLIGSGNILRHGAIFGNSSMVEQMNMYPEWDME